MIKNKAIPHQSKNYIKKQNLFLSKVCFAPKLIVKPLINITTWQIMNKKTNLISQNVKYMFSQKIKKNIWLNNYVKKYNLRNKYIKRKTFYTKWFLLQGQYGKKKTNYEKKWYFLNKNMRNKKKKLHYYQNNFLTFYNNNNFYKYIIW